MYTRDDQFRKLQMRRYFRVRAHATAERQEQSVESKANVVGLERPSDEMKRRSMLQLWGIKCAHRDTEWVIKEGRRYVSSCADTTVERCTVGAQPASLLSLRSARVRICACQGPSTSPYAMTPREQHTVRNDASRGDERFAHRPRHSAQAHRGSNAAQHTPRATRRWHLRVDRSRCCWLLLSVPR